MPLNGTEMSAYTLQDLGWPAEILVSILMSATERAAAKIGNDISGEMMKRSRPGPHRDAECAARESLCLRQQQLLRKAYTRQIDTPQTCA
jgi:hypothetical protein